MSRDSLHSPLRKGGRVKVREVLQDQMQGRVFGVEGQKLWEPQLYILTKDQLRIYIPSEEDGGQSGEKKMVPKALIHLNKKPVWVESLSLFASGKEGSFLVQNADGVEYVVSAGSDEKRDKWVKTITGMLQSFGTLASKAFVLETDGGAPVSMTPMMSRFAVEGFDPVKYAHEKFKEMERQEMLKHLKRLRQEQVRASGGLKHKVVEHYGQFINISKEVTSMEEVDVFDLGNLLRDEFAEIVDTVQSSIIRIGQDCVKEGPEHYLVERIDEMYKQKEKEDTEFQTLRDLPSELEILCQERHFVKAVKRILEGLERLERVEGMTDADEVSAKVWNQAQRIADLLVDEIHGSKVSRVDMRLNLGLLLELGMKTKAIDAFLSTRSSRIKDEVRKLGLEGDIPVVYRYVESLSNVVFASIRDGSLEFKRIFADCEVGSELKAYNSVFQRQVSQSDHSDQVFGTIARCIGIARSYASELEEYGLSVTYFLDQLFEAGLANVFGENSVHFTDKMMQLSRNLDHEEWRARQMVIPASFEPKNIKHKPVVLTYSAQVLYKMCFSFITSVQCLVELNSSLCASVEDVIVRLVDEYISQLGAVTSGATLTDRQWVSVIANVFYVSLDLIPRLIMAFERTLKFNVEELSRMTLRVDRVRDELIETCCSSRAHALLEELLQWDTVPYETLEGGAEKMSESVGDAHPSETFQQLFMTLSKLALHATTLLNDHLMREMVVRILEQLTVGFHHGRLWNKGDVDFQDGEWEVLSGELPRVRLTRKGVHQLVLDMRFFEAAGGHFLNERALENLDKVEHTACALFTGPDGLEPKMWFDFILSSTMADLRATLGEHWFKEP